LHDGLTAFPVDAFCACAGNGAGGVDPEITSAMIEKEKHKLEVLKRRQERDIQQVCSTMCTARFIHMCFVLCGVLVSITPVLLHMQPCSSLLCVVQLAGCL
jgi:VIT1/CCC1 family predicted Fe2+/Mn2+ transporter